MWVCVWDSGVSRTYAPGRRHRRLVLVLEFQLQLQLEMKVELEVELTLVLLLMLQLLLKLMLLLVLMLVLLLASFGMQKMQMHKVHAKASVTRRKQASRTASSLRRKERMFVSGAAVVGNPPFGRCEMGAPVRVYYTPSG